MGMNTLNYCNKIMQNITERGFEREVSFAELKQAIRFTAGSKPETIRRYVKELLEFGFLQEKNPAIFTILKTRIEGY